MQDIVARRRRPPPPAPPQSARRCIISTNPGDRSYARARIPATRAFPSPGVPKKFPQKHSHTTVDHCTAQTALSKPTRSRLKRIHPSLQAPQFCSSSVEGVRPVAAGIPKISGSREGVCLRGDQDLHPGLIHGPKIRIRHGCPDPVRTAIPLLRPAWPPRASRATPAFAGGPWPTGTTIRDSR